MRRPQAHDIERLRTADETQVGKAPQLSSSATRADGAELILLV